tara:strand:+ start:1 stop:1785 length:1785 start_codon:yes stop_codon:yes gene_type:complete
MNNPYGVSKAKAKRIAMSLIDVYTRGDIGDQDFRSLTQLWNNPTTGEKYTNDEAMDNIANRMIKIASEQTYWRNNYTEMGAPRGNQQNTNNSAFKPVSSSAINGGLSWAGFDEYMDKKTTAINAIASGDIQSANYISTVNALRSQEIQIVNTKGTPDQIDDFNEMSQAFRGHSSLRDLLHFMTYNTNKHTSISVPEDIAPIDFEGKMIEVPSSKKSSGLAGGKTRYTYQNKRSWFLPRIGEYRKMRYSLFGNDDLLKTQPKELAQFIGRLNATIGTQYTVDDLDMLTNLFDNYWKYQVTSGVGDGIDQLVEQNEDITVQRTGYAVNTYLDGAGTLGDINDFITQITPSQFSIEGIPTEEDEWKRLWNEVIPQAKRDNSFKFKHITIPGVSSGTTANFVLNVAPGENYSFNENIGGTSGTGYTDALLERISSSAGGNPLLLELERAARSVKQKITDGTYQVTHDGHISVKDYMPEITPVLMQANLLDYLNNVQAEHGYKPDLTQLSEDEFTALNSALFNKSQIKIMFIMQKLMFMAHLEKVRANQAPSEYLNIEDEAELWNVLSQDPTYRAELESHAGSYSSSKITDLINQELYK